MVTNLSFGRLYIWTRTLKSWHLNPLMGRNLRYVAHDVKLCDIPVLLVLIWGCLQLSPYWNKFLRLSTHSQHSPIGFSLIVLKEFWLISDWTTPHPIGLKFNLNLAYLQNPPNIPRNAWSAATVLQSCQSKHNNLHYLTNISVWGFQCPRCAIMRHINRLWRFNNSLISIQLSTSWSEMEKIPMDLHQGLLINR